MVKIVFSNDSTKKMSNLPIIFMYVKYFLSIAVKCLATNLMMSTGKISWKASADAFRVKTKHKRLHQNQIFPENPTKTM